MTNKVVVQKVVGEICIRGEASSDRRDVSMQDLLDIANKAAGNEGEVTGRDGVNLTIVMSGPDAPAEPLFTPAPDVFDEVRNGVLGGVHYGPIKKAEDLHREQEAEKRAVNQREETVDIFRRRLRDAAFGYKMNHEGFQAAIENVICEAANVYRNTLVAADKDKAERALMKANLARLNTENMELRQEVDDAVRAMQKQAADFNKQADIHTETVNNILATCVATEKELEEANRKIKRMKDYAVRLNSIS